MSGLHCPTFPTAVARWTIAFDFRGIDPCPELSERAGIWRYSAEKKGQTLKDGDHFATGIRNAVAMAIEPRSNELYVMQHGRDQLDNFPAHFTPEKNAVAPAEEMLHIRKGDDYGWPCVRSTITWLPAWKSTLRSRTTG